MHTLQRCNVMHMNGRGSVVPDVKRLLGQPIVSKTSCVIMLYNPQEVAVKPCKTKWKPLQQSDCYVDIF